MKYKQKNPTKRLFAGFDVGSPLESSIKEKHKSYHEEIIFKNGMKRMSQYKEIASLNNHNYYKTPSTFKNISRAVDVAYVNSHGSNFAYLYFFLKKKDGKYTSFYSSLATDKSVAEAKGGKKVNEIGARLLNNGTNTTSAYTKTTKYLILGGCAQLNYETAVWSGLTATQLWARTMWGNGKKLHGIMGYFNKAPGLEPHGDRLKSFLDYLSNGDSFATAWSTANGDSTNWAYIIREDCIFESAYTMKPALRNNVKILPCKNPRTFRGNSINNTHIVSGAGHAEQFNELNDTLSNEKTAIMTNKKKFSQKQKNEISSALLSDETQSMFGFSATQKTTKIMLDITDDGRLKYKNDCFDWKSDCGMNQEEAIDLAKDTLSKIGLLPLNSYRVDVASITCEEIPLMACEFVKPKKIVSYTVRFIPVINGRDVLADQDNSISVTLCKDGISEIDYNWKDFIAEPSIDCPATQVD